MHKHGIRLLAGACQHAPRESPTALLFLCGPLQALSAPCSALARQLAGLGFSSYTCDLLRPQFSLCTSSPDALVERLQAALREARIFSPPVAIAHYAEAVVLQKYLESHPLAGVALISPLPPAPLPALQALLRSSSSTLRLPKSAECGAAAGAEAAKAALAAALAPRARSATAARMAATFLLRLAQEPVNLEPQPVPMLLLEEEGSRGSEGVAATAALHGLVAARHTPDAAALREWVVARF